MTGVPRACVIGWPIDHSRSPMIHGYWLKQHGIDGAYGKEAVRPEAFAEFVRAMPAEGYVGANVTVPHKEAAFALAEQADDAAMAIGAANTLWLEDGQLFASNTDSYGFLTHLEQSAPAWDRDCRSVAILGAGGAARAIVHGFLKAGVADVRIINRTRERAERLVRHFGPRLRAIDWQARNDGIKGASVLVNTTSLGMAGAPALDIDLVGLAEGGVVADIVYAPLETDLLRRARARCLRPVDGLGMLLHQAVPGFEKWFGVRPEVTDELRDLVVADLEAAPC